MDKEQKSNSIVSVFKNSIVIIFFLWIVKCYKNSNFSQVFVSISKCYKNSVLHIILQNYIFRNPAIDNSVFKKALKLFSSFLSRIAAFIYKIIVDVFRKGGIYSTVKSMEKASPSGKLSLFGVFLLSFGIVCSIAALISGTINKGIIYYILTAAGLFLVYFSSMTIAAIKNCFIYKVLGDLFK